MDATHGSKLHRSPQTVAEPSVSLTDRALALVGQFDSTAKSVLKKTVAVGVTTTLVVAPLASAAIEPANGLTHTVQWSGIGFGPGSGGAFTGDGSVGATVSNNIVKMWGFAHNITGNDWENLSPFPGSDTELIFSAQGNTAGTAYEGVDIVLEYDFDIEVSGGTVAWSVAAVQSIYQQRPNGYLTWSSLGFGKVSTSGTLSSDDAISGALSADVFNEQNTVAASNNNFFVDLTLMWSGYQPDDVLSVTIPENSIDYGVGTLVPEPSTTLMLGLLIAVTVFAGRQRPNPVRPP